MDRVRAGLAFVIVSALWVVLACASPRGVPGYDGDLIPQSNSGDSALYVRVLIDNLRTEDATPPRIYLDGSGRHDLGIIQSIDGHINRLVDTSWFGPSGCFTIIAHFVGRGDLSFSRVCWRPGETVGATLLNHWDPNTAWSHR